MLVSYDTNVKRTVNGSIQRPRSPISSRNLQKGPGCPVGNSRRASPGSFYKALNLRPPGIGHLQRTGVVGAFGGADGRNTRCQSGGVLRRAPPTDALLRGGNKEHGTLGIPLEQPIGRQRMYLKLSRCEQNFTVGKQSCTLGIQSFTGLGAPPFGPWAFRGGGEGPGAKGRGAVKYEVCRAGSAIMLP
jgi:hypothetical protein